jgi:hypothetical protein
MLTRRSALALLPIWIGACAQTGAHTAKTTMATTI